MQKHPSVVVEHKDMILNCLSDEDVTIRMRALDLITAMVSKKNLNGIITRLVSHLDTSDGSYKDTVLERIIFICSQNNYDYVSDFGWYDMKLFCVASDSISVLPIDIHFDAGAQKPVCCR
jgi:AP-3 complex subunit delta-1